MISETPDKYITSMWNDWKEKVCDSRMPDSWSWPCVWDDYSGMEDLQDLKLRERIYLADILTCQFCSSVMETPYTLQCGCSSCKSCCKMDSQSISIDHICVLCSKESYLNSKTLKVNVVLNSFLNKWFTDFSRALKLNRKGHTALKCKEFDTGVKCFDQAVELCPNNPTLWKDRAVLLFDLGRTEQALESIERACSLGSRLSEVYFEKGKILCKSGRPQDAAVALMISAVTGRDYTNSKEHFKTNGNAKLINNVNAKDDSKVIELLNKAMTDLAYECQYHTANSGSGFEHFREQQMGTDELESCPSSTPLHNVLGRVAEEIKDIKSKSSENMFPVQLTDEEMEHLANDLECNLCNRLFFEPVTTSCGHVFCRECLRRWLDHNYKCPMCRFSLFEFVAIWKLEVSTLLDKLIRAFFPSEVEKRASSRLKEMEEFSSVANDTEDFIPIFICAVILPSRPLHLQIFEPRYRLMLRKCLESGGAQFGMCAYDPNDGFADYGTMVEIRNAYFVPDGRAFVECWGGRRFKVLSKGVRDGYSIAKVEWIRDVEIPMDQLEHVITMNNDVYAAMKAYLINFVRQRDTDLLEFPEIDLDKISSRDGPDWIWWLIEYFLNSTKFQLTMIATKSLEERLSLLQKHLELKQL